MTDQLTADVRPNSLRNTPGETIPKVLIDTSSPTIGVQLLRNVHGPNGAEFFAGHGYGFAEASALSLVLNGVAKARVFDRADLQQWSARLAPYAELLKAGGKVKGYADLLHFLDAATQAQFEKMDAIIQRVASGEEVTVNVDRATGAVEVLDVTNPPAPVVTVSNPDVSADDSETPRPAITPPVLAVKPTKRGR